VPAGSEDALRQSFEEVWPEARELVQDGRSSATLGWILLLVGAWFLLDSLGWLRVNGDLPWPVLLIGLGTVLLLGEQP